MSKDKCIVQVPTYRFMISSDSVVTSVQSPGSFEIFTKEKEVVQGIQPGVLRVGDAITNFQGTKYSVGRPKASSVLSEYMGKTEARIISTQNLGIV